MGTVADLHASASRITGLSDFGPDDYTDGLGVLLESYARDAALTPAGEKATRSLLRGAADQVEECWQLLRQSMRSVSFECLAHLPTYSAWLRDQDWTAAYLRHRRNWG